MGEENDALGGREYGGDHIAFIRMNNLRQGHAHGNLVSGTAQPAVDAACIGANGGQIRLIDYGGDESAVAVII